MMGVCFSRSSLLFGEVRLAVEVWEASGVGAGVMSLRAAGAGGPGGCWPVLAMAAAVALSAMMSNVLPLRRGDGVEGEHAVKRLFFERGTDTDRLTP